MGLGIAKKIIILFVFLVAASGTTLGYFLLQHEHGALLQEFDSRASVLLSSLAVSTEFPVLVGDKHAVEKIGASALTQKDVVFCQIINKEGKILFTGGSPNALMQKDYSMPIITERFQDTGQEGLYR